VEWLTLSPQTIEVSRGIKPEPLFVPYVDNRLEDQMHRRWFNGKVLLGGAALISLALLVVMPASAKAFVHGIVINVDGSDYYLAGPPDGPDGARDIPGHYWVQAGPNQLVGKHYNTGPFGAPSWWSSDAEDGEYLYKVHGIIDTWSAEKAARYASRGYVHYHELVKVSDGSLHPMKVVWLRHTARTSFTLDGGPRPDLAHTVTPGIDYEFINTYLEPYSP
jgi:selenium-binding protein 1